MVLSVLARATDADIDAFVAGYHSDYPLHPFPAGLFNPLHRMQRWP
jgi:hypothetical protein